MARFNFQNIMRTFLFLALSTKSDLGPKTKNFLQMHTTAKTRFAFNGGSLHYCHGLFHRTAPAPFLK